MFIEPPRQKLSACSGGYRRCKPNNFQHFANYKHVAPNGAKTRNAQHLAPTGAKTGADTRQRLERNRLDCRRLEGASGTLALESVR